MEALPIIAIVLSAISLAISGLTAYLTLFHRGTVKMTRPTMVYFGPDGPTPTPELYLPKVTIRSLLFATSKKGRIIESIYTVISRNEAKHYFGVWSYGRDKHLVRGSGLFVGETGVEAYHHFLPHDESREFRFKTGTYKIEVFAHLLGDDKDILLFSDSLLVTSDLSGQLENVSNGLYFDWGSESRRYLPHIHKGGPDFTTVLDSIFRDEMKRRNSEN